MKCIYFCKASDETNESMFAAYSGSAGHDTLEDAIEEIRSHDMVDAKIVEFEKEDILLELGKGDYVVVDDRDRIDSTHTEKGLYKLSFIRELELYEAEYEVD